MIDTHKLSVEKRLELMPELLSTLSSLVHHYGGYYNEHHHHNDGYGGYGHHGGYHDCCPLVVNPLTYIALLSFLAAAVYLLREQIFMSNLMMAKRRKRRDLMHFDEIITSGRLTLRCLKNMKTQCFKMFTFNLISFS